MKSGSSFGTLKTEIPAPVVSSYKVEEKDSETDSPQPPGGGGVNPDWAPVEIWKYSRAETSPAINNRSFIYNKRTEAQWQSARCSTLQREVMRRRSNEVYSGVGDQLLCSWLTSSCQQITRVIMHRWMGEERSKKAMRALESWPSLT